MKVINISKKQFNSLRPLILPNGVTNTECELFHYSYHGREMLIKKLYRYNDISFANKLYTIQAIDYNKNYIPDCFVKPEYLVSISRNIEAFLIEYCNGVNLSTIFNDYSIAFEEKIGYLKNIGGLLEQMKNIRQYSPLKDFYLGDLHEDNFIANSDNKSLRVIDVDSIKIANNGSFPSKYLSNNSLLNNTSDKYKKRLVEGQFDGYDIDENTDIYCYVIVILNFLYGGNINNISLNDFYGYLNYLNDLKIDDELLDCFNRIVSNGNNINPVNYLDSLTANQICRANKRVYKYNK